MRYLAKAASERPSALADCDKDLYPNMYTPLQIACTLPVTSCECERNASTLRRLRNFMRAGMSENRLSSLALMHIHYDHEALIQLLICLLNRSQGSCN